MFVSVAVLVTVSNASALTVCMGMVGNDGATFTSLTTTVNELVSLKLGVPLSVTTVVIVFVAGLCVWAAVQVMTPLVSMFAPVGGDKSRKESVSGGRSKSTAGLVPARHVNSLTERLVCADNMGAEFNTVRVNVVAP